MQGDDSGGGRHWESDQELQVEPSVGGLVRDMEGLTQRRMEPQVSAHPYGSSVPLSPAALSVPSSQFVRFSIQLFCC